MLMEPMQLENVWRWIEENAQQLDAEKVDHQKAHGRVPAASLRGASDVPATPCAVEAGYAVRAEETLGAAPYNALPFSIVQVGDGALPRGTVARIGAGQPLPAGADALLPSDAVELEADGRISIVTPLAEGEGAVMAATELRAGDALWPAESRRQPLRPAEIGLLSAAGILPYPDPDRRQVGCFGRPRPHASSSGRA
jgi:molybdopterin molybdotransferase